MLLLIDAYNLLHHSDVLGRGRGPRWLEQARKRLVLKLAEHLDAELASETYLVFDAHSPPPDVPARYRVKSIRLLYAVDHPEADDLIEELIARHPTPRRLTVISSDHRIQRAAARRGATFYDADAWYDELVERGPRLGIRWPRPDPGRPPGDAAGAEKPAEPATAAELAEWFDHFSLHMPPAAKEQGKTRKEGKPEKRAGTKKKNRLNKKGDSGKKTQTGEQDKPSDPHAGAPRPEAEHRPQRRRRAGPPRDPHRPLDPESDNPFPDGYAEDLE